MYEWEMDIYDYYDYVVDSYLSDFFNSVEEEEEITEE